MVAILSCFQLCLLFFCTSTIFEVDSVKFTYPNGKETVYGKVGGNTTFRWNYSFGSKTNANLIRIDCGYYSLDRTLQILTMLVGNKKADLNKEDFPPRFKNRIHNVSGGKDRISFTITNITTQDEHPFLCRMFYWEGEIYDVKGPVFSHPFSLVLMEPQKVSHCLDKKSYQLSVNKSAHFTCNISGNPMPNVTCMVIGRDGSLVMTSPTVHNGSLNFYIPSSKPSMAIIRCTSLQQLSAPIIKQSVIKILGKPQHVQLRVSSHHPKISEMLRLDCLFISHPSADKVSIFRNNKMISFGKKRVVFTVNDCDSANGLYHCEVENKLGRVKSSRQRIQTSYKPRITAIGENSVGMIGQNVTVQCSAIGCPTPKIRWRKQGDPNFAQEVSSLKLTGLDISDAGTYICVAQNDIGTALANTTISIKHKPLRAIFTSNAVKGRIRAGNKLKLRCSAKSSPTGYYSFYKNGNLLVENESGEAELEDIRCTKDGGNYTCIPENTIGQGDKLSMWIYVEDEPVITVAPISQTVNVSSDVVFKCHATGCPTPNVFWRRKGSPAVIHSGNVLQIKGTRREDASSYVCVASNRIGQKSEEATLQIILKQKLKDGNSAQRLYGKMAILQTVLLSVLFSVFVS